LVYRSIVWIGTHYVVQYMKYGSRYPAKEFLDALPDKAVRARFVALAKHLATFGRLPSESQGRFLSSKRYAGLYELKPDAFRVFGFFHKHNLYLTNAAAKTNAKAQKQDYEVARTMRDDFLKGIKKKKR
jgi:hypothetical protein